MSKLKLILPEASVRRLESIVECTDAKDPHDVLNRALTTFESLVEHAKEGAIFHATMPDGEVREVAWSFELQERKPYLRVVK